MASEVEEILLEYNSTHRLGNDEKYFKEATQALLKLIEAEVQDALARQATPTVSGKQADNLNFTIDTDIEGNDYVRFFDKSEGDIYGDKAIIAFLYETAHSLKQSIEAEKVKARVEELKHLLEVAEEKLSHGRAMVQTVNTNELVYGVTERHLQDRIKELKGEV